MLKDSTTQTNVCLLLKKTSYNWHCKRTKLTIEGPDADLGYREVETCSSVDK
jgi:hypothetical protein